MSNNAVLRQDSYNIFTSKMELDGNYCYRVDLADIKSKINTLPTTAAKPYGSTDGMICSNLILVNMAVLDVPLVKVIGN